MTEFEKTIEPIEDWIKEKLKGRIPYSEEIDIAFCAALILEYQREQCNIPIVSPRTSEIKKAVKEKLTHYKTLIGHPDYNSDIEQNAAQTLVRELNYLDSITEYEG